MPGDVILTAETKLRSKAIRKITNGLFSHAILYLGGSSYIHSDGAGVHSGNTQRLLFTKQSHSLVVRLSNREDSKVTEICMFARTQIGKEYSVPEAMRSKFKRGEVSEEDSNRQFCSRLVSQAYAHAGILIVKNFSYCYPQDIADSQFMTKIGDCLRVASVEEVEFAESDNPLEKQEEITNSIFKKIRSLTGKDIQTFEQVSNYLLIHPERDAEVSKILEESGYLNLWLIDVQKHPWHYDQEEFLSLNIPRHQKLELASQHQEAAANQLKQFQFMHMQCLLLWQTKQLKYFALEMALYNKLIELTKARITAAEYVLTNA